MLEWSGTLKTQYPLARHTSWRVGGAAERCYLPKDFEDLCIFLRTVPPDEPLSWLGLGSNVLVRDGGVPGTTIYTLGRLKQLALVEGVVRAEAGVTCAKLAKFCARNGFEQGAFFSGIPGTVGGALAMNAGAFGGETWTHVVAVAVVDRFARLSIRGPETFDIGYRQVKGGAQVGFVAGYFAFAAGDPSIAASRIRHCLKARSLTQPIGSFNSGSVFRNPDGDYAGRLIESAGLKGKSIGDAVVSEKHANFIINRGQATASDIEALICYIQHAIRERYAIALVPEVRFLGVPLREKTQ